MRGLTNKQRQVLAFLKGYIKEHKYPPTFREIAKTFSISVKGAYDHVKALEKKGELRCELNKSRAIEIVSPELTEEDRLTNVPLLGNVAAGVPLFAEENLDGHLQLPTSVLKRGKHFALHVKGDSMQDAGIIDGDIAVFLQQNVANNGDIVVAMMNEAVTLKRFYKEKNRVKLKAENPVYPPIYTQNVQILGKLVYVCRQYE